jgi:hypothetical protein
VYVNYTGKIAGNIYLGDITTGKHFAISLQPSAATRSSGSWRTRTRVRGSGTALANSRRSRSQPRSLAPPAAAPTILRIATRLILRPLAVRFSPRSFSEAIPRPPISSGKAAGGPLQLPGGIALAGNRTVVGRECSRRAPSEGWRVYNEAGLGMRKRKSQPDGRK